MNLSNLKIGQTKLIGKTDSNFDSVYISPSQTKMMAKPSKGRDYFSCEICDKNISTSYVLDHLKTHTKEEIEKHDYDLIFRPKLPNDLFFKVKKFYESL